MARESIQSGWRDPQCLGPGLATSGLHLADCALKKLAMIDEDWRIYW